MSIAQVTACPTPVPLDAAEQVRVAHTRLRRRMCLSEHEADVREYIAASIGQVRASAWGKPDLSGLPVVQAAEAKSTLFDPTEDGRSAPFLSCAMDPSAVPLMDLVLDEACLWPSMPRIQRDTLVMREEFIRLDSVVDEGGQVRIRARPVTADMCSARSDPRDPHRLVEVREWRWELGQWVQDVWCIDGEPAHRFLSADGADLSDRFGLPAGGERGEAYPVLTSTGRPRLPYVLLHAALGTGVLFDYRSELGLVDGSLQLALRWSLQGHVSRNAAWAQRWTIGAEFGGITTSGNGAQQVEADPAVVLNLRAQEGFDGSPSAGQWSPTASPLEMAEANLAYERRLYSMAGMDPADVQRVSGDPRSGYALAVSTKSKEIQSLRFAPVFRPAVVELVCLAAVLVNRATGRPLLPEIGWDVEFAPIRAIRARMAPPTPLVGLAQTVTAIATACAQGQLPRDAALAQIGRLYGIAPEDAEPLLGSIGRGFRASTP